MTYDPICDNCLETFDFALRESPCPETLCPPCRKAYFEEQRKVADEVAERVRIARLRHR